MRVPRHTGVNRRPGGRREFMRTAGMRRILMSRFLLLCVLVVSMTGCATLGGHTVVLDERADARLDIAVKNGLFTTTARIGPVEARPFVIDSGADHLYVDSELAKKLNPSSWSARDSLGAKPNVKWGRLTLYQIGPMTLRHTLVGVTDFSAASASFGERLAGLLGYPFFANAVVEVDYPHGTVSCFDPKTYRLPGGHWQPLALTGNRPTLAARLEGNIEGQFLLDTGNTSTVLFFPGFVREHSLLQNRRVRSVTLTRATGDTETLAGRIAWFEFAGHRFEKPMVQFDPPNNPRGSQGRLAGVIGRGFLRQFIVVFNYPESRIAFLPRRSSDEKGDHRW